jgi:phosphoesterase RecJ-like protein
MSLDQAALAAVAARMRGETLVALAVHENPDLDAVGAVVGMADLFAQLGVSARVHVAPGVELPLAAELAPHGLATTDPVPAEATVYAMDTGSRRRMALSLDGWDGTIVNVDHHQDNERFGAVDLVDGESSSTSEMVTELAGELGLRPGPAAATALYAGISFDTGHFQHASTSARTFAVAGALVEDGADPNRVYRLLYEGRSLASLRLWGRAVAGALSLCDGRALVAVLDDEDYRATGGSADDTEGVVESLRGACGCEVAALVRRDGERTRVSLRSNGLDVSAVAALRGGGGHRQAAGLTVDESPEEVAEWLSTVLAERLPTASS